MPMKEGDSGFMYNLLLCRTSFGVTNIWSKATDIVTVALDFDAFLFAYRDLFSGQTSDVYCNELIDAKD